MNKRIHDLEFRYGDDTRPPEIIRWHENEQGKYLYTLLFYEKGSEGYDIRFVGARPLEYENTEKLWALMKYGNRVLDALFRLEEDWE
jgi:hypothetical protein